jgi:phospholipid transport system substrate-binding protein
MTRFVALTSRFAFALLLLLNLAGGAALAAPTDDPKVVAQNVYNDIKANLTADTSNGLVDQYFDTHIMAVQALGLPYRSLSDAQKSGYTQAFDVYFKRTLFHVLTTYKDATISNLLSRISGNSAEVHCTVKAADGQSIDLSLTLVASQQNNWKAIEVTVDNVGLITSYKPQFKSLYEQHGYDGLIGYLNSH